MPVTKQKHAAIRRQRKKLFFSALEKLEEELKADMDKKSVEVLERKVAYYKKQLQRIKSQR